MTETLTYAGRLVQRSCWCGIRHAIPSELNDEVNRGKNAYCPLGHSYVAAEETVEEERERIRKWADAQVTHARDQQRAAERSAAAARGQVTKIKHRIHAGVCPHCNRTFANVARHMASQHPSSPRSRS